MTYTMEGARTGVTGTATTVEASWIPPKWEADCPEVEVYQKSTCEPGGVNDVIVPTHVTINGRTVLCTDDGVTVATLSNDSIATVTLTLIVKKLTVYTERSGQTP